jgi:NhaP-type Na+/H+ or K+/H+ antiporter
MMAWFGIRGIGSIYYLMHAIHQGLPRPLGEPIVAITLAAATVPIVLDGMSVRPMMHLCGKLKLPQAP